MATTGLTLLPASIIQTYVTPRLIYGLDSIVLNKKDSACLETYYRQLLRQIQGLPDTVGNAAVYLLLDTIPLEAQLHTRILGLFGSIMTLKDDHPLRKLALRQMALKDGKSHSWFNYIVSTATTYDIDIQNAVVHPWPKKAWNRYIKESIKQHWINQQTEQAGRMTSLTWFMVIEKLPPLW